tara:strand:+ start:164 stop:841 length:678 start_codon:yes stop_codon:yes gene_type:complete
MLIFFFYIGFFKKKIFYKKVFTFIFIIFSIISVLPVGHNLIYFFLEKKFSFVKIPGKVDYIFVPSGSLQRVIYAINLKNSPSLKSVKILYSSGSAYLDKSKGEDIETDLIKNLILSSNLNKDNIIFLPDARNTYENFKRLNEYLIEKDKSDSKILLITDAFHMSRSLMLAKKFNLDISGLPSSYITMQNPTGLINSYQSLRFTGNLSKFDIFIKELISKFFSIFL